ncbi:ABC transporter permease [Patescibacteria group bacterium]|nr:ABC transporter permease [Patescibacteria group bacterium]
MKFFDYIRVAFQNLIRQKARTFLTVIAVVIGAVSVVIMLSLVLGARSVFVRQLESIGGLTLVSISGDASQSGGSDLFSNTGNQSSASKKVDDAALAAFKKRPHIVTVTPVGTIWANSMKLKGTNKENTQMDITALDPTAGVLAFPVVAGRPLNGSDMDKIVIGAHSLSVFGFTNPQDAIGKEVAFEFQGPTTDWEPDPPKPVPGSNGNANNNDQNQVREIDAEIVGVLPSGQNDRQDFITIGWARKLMTWKMWQPDNAAMQQANQESSRPGQLSQEPPPPIFKLVKTDVMAQRGYGSAMVKVDSTDNVKAVGDSLKKDGWGVTTAQDVLDGISKIFLALGIALGTIGGIALFVAAIGIINTMAMAIYERTREIGVMRACGATRATVRRLFTFEAALLGFLGGAIGLLVSYGLAKIGNVVADRVATSQNIPISGIITFPLWLVLGTIAFTTLIGWLAGLYPAFRAARLDPVEALRYE